jgi:glycosyltransferase involved in cell wall biosynthesis
VRLAVYSPNSYRRTGERVYTDRAFVLFLGELARSLGGLRLLGRLREHGAPARYELPAEIEFVALPDYETLARPGVALIAMARSLRTCWDALGGVDAVWVLGPHPLGVAVAGMALLRRRRVALGVRQDTLAYVRSRHPDRPFLRLAGVVLEAVWRGLARASATVVVGPELARRYGRARRLHELTVSLIRARDVAASPRPEAAARPPTAEILSVGRLEEEKNPLMLADVLAQLSLDPNSRWRLRVCGEGPLAEPLRERLAELGVEDQAAIDGYVPFDRMADLYAAADVLLSTSWTEGFPQVMVEAFAAGLPVVTTDVGGIREAAGDAVLLFPPGDAQAGAVAIQALDGDGDRRRALVEEGLSWARRHTIEAEVARLAAFLTADD